MLTRVKLWLSDLLISSSTYSLWHVAKSIHTLFLIWKGFVNVCSASVRLFLVRNSGRLISMLCFQRVCPVTQKLLLSCHLLKKLLVSHLDWANILLILAIYFILYLHYIEQEVKISHKWPLSNWLCKKTNPWRQHTYLCFHLYTQKYSEVLFQI